MRMINRSAFVVTSRTPYREWVQSHGGDPAEETGLVSVYLVPEDSAGEDETPPLKDFYVRIFEAELEAWTTDVDTWPETRDLATFNAWFSVVGESVIVDLGEGSIEVEEL